MSILQKIKARQSMIRAAEPVEDKPSLSQSMKERLDLKKAEGRDHYAYAEVNRITALPIIDRMTDEEVEEFSRNRVLARAFAHGFRLRRQQAEGLREFERYWESRGHFGALCSIGVGKGKTLLSLMMADVAYRSGVPKIMLMIPPEVLVQLVEYQLKEARTQVPISYPVHVLGGRPIHERRAMATSGRKGLYIMPYSLLSTKDTDANLEDINPGLIIADEAHRVSNRNAARTKRVIRYIHKHTPHFVPLSGTITSKSVMDYLHLAQAALKQNNFLPNATSMAEEWGSIIDAEQVNWGSTDRKESREHSGPGPLMPLVEWAKDHFPDQGFPHTTEGFRRAFKMRKQTCPGVVTSDGEELGVSLWIVNDRITGHEDVEGWGELERLIAQVEDMWLTPNGDEITHAIHTWKWLFELSAGFYNQLTWPEVDKISEERKISKDEARDLLGRSMAQFDALQEYRRGLRTWIERYAKAGLDTPKLIGSNMAHHGDEYVGSDLYNLWERQRGMRFEGMIERVESAVRVCPFKIMAATIWAMENRDGGIVWYWSREVGRWLYEMMLEAGVDAIHCPAGNKHNATILDPANRGRIAVASIRAHGTGKNLQHNYHKQCFVQWPRSARTAEQVLGRLHRIGQEADEVAAVLFNTLLFDDMNFAACLNDSLYIHQTGGGEQKLIYANYNPLPKIFPSAVLRERGAEVKSLSAEQQAMMKEKFGG